jgi:hypothetical protein
MQNVFHYIISVILLLSFPVMFEKVGGQSEDTLSAISPKLFDANGNELNGTIVPDKQVILSANLSKSLDDHRSSVAIFEIIDSNDVAIYLAWQTIDVPSNGTREIGVSWLSGNEGNYELKVIHVLTLVNPGLIYGSGSSNFTIIDARS